MALAQVVHWSHSQQPWSGRYSRYRHSSVSQRPGRHSDSDSSDSDSDRQDDFTISRHPYPGPASPPGSPPGYPLHHHHDTADTATTNAATTTAATTATTTTTILAKTPTILATIPAKTPTDTAATASPPPLGSPPSPSSPLHLSPSSPLPPLPPLPLPPSLPPSSLSIYRHTRRIPSSSSSSSPSAHRRRPWSRPIDTMPPDYRHARTSSMSITNSSTRPASSVLPRSPPNTSHVPCKFFRQGACQAGNACPFSHELGAASENVCKYFAKGNCKFGPKCANIHVLPDGRRVNYGKNGFTIITAPTAAPNSPTLAVNSIYDQSSASALTTSLYEAGQAGAFPNYLHDSRQHLQDHHHPNLDNGHSSDHPFPFPESYGSQRDGFAFAPPPHHHHHHKALSVLDAPMPASFDSNGISNAARFPAAPWPSSVPSQFGIDSPSASLSNAKDSRTSDTLKLLHSSAFGSSDQCIIPGSPPTSNMFASDEYFGKRAMHSSRHAKLKMFSSSVPKTNVDRDWEAGFAFGDDVDGPENYVPENLQDLLTPAEKARRGTARTDNDVATESLSKYNSPMASSPSRWNALFQRQKEEEELSRSARNVASPFGHVGSPLRTSTLVQDPSGVPGRSSSMRITSDSMSVLSQQLQRSRIEDAAAITSSPRLHPSSARTAASNIAPIGKDRPMERHVSTGSISSSVTGRFTTPIDEEESAFVFSMEEDDPTAAARMRKRASAGLAMGSFNSYAGVVTGKCQEAKTRDTKTSTNGR